MFSKIIRNISAFLLLLYSLLKFNLAYEVYSVGTGLGAYRMMAVTNIIIGLVIFILSVLLFLYGKDR